MDKRYYGDNDARERDRLAATISGAPGPTGKRGLRQRHRIAPQ